MRGCSRRLSSCACILVKMLALRSCRTLFQNLSQTGVKRQITGNHYVNNLIVLVLGVQGALTHGVARKSR